MPRYSRIFHPPTYAHKKYGLLLASEYPTGFTRLAFNDRSLVIDICGLVTKANTPEEKGAYGIWFAKGSKWNRSALLPASVTINNQAAELHAACTALKAINKGTVTSAIDLVVVKVGSTYIPKGIDQIIWIWEENNYRNTFGKEASHADMWKELHKCCSELEGKGVKVKFWKVKRSENGAVEDLAREAFKENDVAPA